MIVCIGEVVWDIFPQRQVMGGAPINVAYHLSCLNIPVKTVSRVGNDELGRAVCKQLQNLGLPIDAIQVDDQLATGQVLITLGNNHEPHFEIVAPAAWDNISLERLPDLPEGDFALVFGTLGQRDPRSRRTIRELCRKASYRFYDVNLRPPHTNKELVEDSLAMADMVKVNGEELLILAKWFGISALRKTRVAGELAAQFDVESIVVTEGKDGAWLLNDSEVFTVPGCPVRVADTVGAGDAFFAALIAGFLQETPWLECLRMANARGAYVASQHGATPSMAGFKLTVDN